MFYSIYQFWYLIIIIGSQKVLGEKKKILRKIIFSYLILSLKKNQI